MVGTEHRGLVASPDQNGGPVLIDSGGQLGGQAGLPHSRFSGQEGDTPLPRRRFFPQLAEPFEVDVTSDEDATQIRQEGRERDA